MKLWLDDVRPAPEGWHWVRTAEEALAWMRARVVEECSLDHDLGGVEANKGWAAYDFSLTDGGWLVNRMIAENRFPPVITVHSWNPVARERMFSPLLAAIQERKLDVKLYHKPMLNPS